MAATMEKSDVIYGGDEKVTPNKVDWSKVTALAKGYALDLVAAKKACEEAAKDPNMANAYVKVGIIGDDLCVRVKLKKGMFKKTIREDTVISKGYRKMKESKEKEAKVEQKTLNKENKILQKTPEKAAKDGQLDKQIALQFDGLLKNEVVHKYDSALKKMKECGDALAKWPMTRAVAVQAKTLQAGMSPLITGLDKALKAIDALVLKNAPKLDARKKEIDPYRKVDVLRSEANDFAGKVKIAVNLGRQGVVVTEEYRVERDKVVSAYQKVINGLKALFPRASGLLGPAKAAVGFDGIKKEYDKIDTLRNDAINIFSATREGSEITANAKKVLTKDDIADYLFDLTTEAKTANLTISEGMRAAAGVLLLKLKPLVGTNPAGPDLLKKIELLAKPGMNN